MVQEGAKGFHFQEGQSNIRAGGLPAEFYLVMLVGGWGADLVQWKSWGKGIREQPLLVNFTGWQIAPNTCACFCVFINEPQGRVRWALWSVCVESVWELTKNAILLRILLTCWSRSSRVELRNLPFK